MKPVWLGLLFAAFALIGFAPARDAGAQAACLQFPTWEDAQNAHLAAPWLGLDPDGNGLACDCLLYGLPC